jgi:hypothetical protein
MPARSITRCIEIHADMEVEVTFRLSCRKQVRENWQYKRLGRIANVEGESVNPCDSSLVDIYCDVVGIYVAELRRVNECMWFGGEVETYHVMGEDNLRVHILNTGYQQRRYGEEKKIRVHVEIPRPNPSYLTQSPRSVEAV